MVDIGTLNRLALSTCCALLGFNSYAAHAAPICSINVHEPSTVDSSIEQACQEATATTSPAATRARAHLAITIVAFRKADYSLAAAHAAKAEDAARSLSDADFENRQLLLPPIIAARALAAAGTGDSALMVEHADRLRQASALDAEMTLLAYRLLANAGRSDLASAALHHRQRILPNANAIYHHMVSQMAAGERDAAYKSAQWLNEIGRTQFDDQFYMTVAAMIDGGGQDDAQTALADDVIGRAREALPKLEEDLARARQMPRPTLGERLKGSWIDPKSAIMAAEKRLAEGRTKYARLNALRAMALQAAGHFSDSAPYVRTAQEAMPGDLWVLASATRLSQTSNLPSVASLVSAEIVKAVENSRNSRFRNPELSKKLDMKEQIEVLLRMAEPLFGPEQRQDTAWDEGVRVAAQRRGEIALLVGSDGAHSRRALQVKALQAVCALGNRAGAKSLIVTSHMNQYFKEGSNTGAALGAALMGALGGTDGDPIEVEYSDPWRANEVFGKDVGRQKRYLISLAYLELDVPGSLSLESLGCVGVQ